jgi:hypothetical protein
VVSKTFPGMLQRVLCTLRVFGPVEPDVRKTVSIPCTFDYGRRSLIGAQLGSPAASAVSCAVTQNLNAVAENALAGARQVACKRRVVDCGLAEERARKLMREQLDATPPDLRYVVPATCRDGGEDDINRESRAFP